MNEAEVIDMGSLSRDSTFNLLTVKELERALTVWLVAWLKHEPKCDSW